MANRGPKPKDGVSSTPIKGLPSPPKYLDAEAKKQWKRVSGLILKAGYASHLDEDALAQYCVIWSKWTKAEEMVDQTGGAVVMASNGVLMANPWYSLATGHLKEMKPYLDMLGLSPKARAKLKLPEQEEGVSKWDEFD